jgi:Spy/CpxP family protein refolding chaperone
MKMKVLSPRILIVVAFIAAFSGGLLAQGPPPPQDVTQNDFAPERPNLLEGLGLRQDQIRRIRMMNRDRKPAMDAAQQRLREANRNLDMAIYGDSLDESAVQSRLKDFQDAQAEVARIRFKSELELRKILTPDQLARFRMLRARVAEGRRNAQDRGEGPPGERPLQRIRQLPNRQRVN